MIVLIGILLFLLDNIHSYSVVSALGLLQEVNLTQVATAREFHRTGAESADVRPKGGNSQKTPRPQRLCGSKQTKTIPCFQGGNLRYEGRRTAEQVSPLRHYPCHTKRKGCCSMRTRRLHPLAWTRKWTSSS